jgi:integrase
MNFVEPIRDRKKIAQIKNQLRGQRRYRDLLLLVVGINTALRISDLLQLRVGHFIDDHKRIRQRFWINEQKRNKRHEVAINQSIREAFREYLGAYYGVTEEPNNFVFSTPRQMVTPNPSNEVRLGCSSFRSATMLDCREIMVPTV